MTSSVPRIKEHDLGAGRVMDYFRRCRFRGEEESVYAIERTLPPALKRSAEIKALSSWIKQPQEDRRIGLIAADASEVDPLSVIALRRLVHELEPEWVEAVKEACRQTNRLEEIAEEAGELDLNAVAAIVTAMVEAGELPGMEIEGFGEGE